MSAGGPSSAREAAPDETPEVPVGISETPALAGGGAASAGEAGRGFAVVASEVKQLAKQTAAATDEIRSKVEGMQDGTARSVSAIGSIVTIVEEVGELATTVAELAGNQRAEFSGLADTLNAAASSSREVNTLASEASDSAMQVAQNSVELASGADEVASLVARTASRVTDVSSDVVQFADYADESSKAAGDLGEISQAIRSRSERLAEVTNRFRL